MKINRVEELVGITKKNIRFYEEQGLLNPSRNPENGYREYTENDVKTLERIKLLRKLSVPIEEIRMIQEGKLGFSDCMERHIIYLNHKQHDIGLIMELCTGMSKEVASLEMLDASKYLGEMERLEEEGTHFMDIEKKDIRKKKIGPIIAAAFFVALMLALMALFCWAYVTEPMPVGILLLMTLPLLAVMIGVVCALILRLREINGGEEDEASKY